MVIHFRAMILALILVAFSLSAHAGVGLKLSYFSPRGDMGQFFKKAPSYELFGSFKGYKGKNIRRMGVFYTNLTPRLERFPVYDMSTDMNDIVYPGYLSYHKYTIYGFSVEQLFRVYKVNKFNFYAGAGITLGGIEEKYDLNYETRLTSNDVENTQIFGGLKPVMMATYNITNSIVIGTEFAQYWLTSADFLSNFSHRTFSISACYYLYN